MKICALVLAAWWFLITGAEIAAKVGPFIDEAACNAARRAVVQSTHRRLVVGACWTTGYVLGNDN